MLRLLTCLSCVALCSLLALARNDFAPLPALRIVTTQEWGSKPLPIPTTRAHTPSILTLHHAGELWKDSDDPIDKIQRLQRWGQRDKNWPDVPYHFLIAPDGRVVVGRDIRFMPESNTRYDMTGTVNIMLWGNFEAQRVSQPQLIATAQLLARLSTEYNLDLAKLRTHLQAAPGQTTCPGKDFQRYIDQGLIEQWARAIQQGQSPAITELPELPGGPTTRIATTRSAAK
jgi:hypothetical protein